MKIGKISNNDLKKLIFNNLTLNRKEVLEASEIGSDCAVVDLGDELLVTSVDPITGASKNIGSLAVNVACNDAYCLLAEPVGLLMSVLLPAKTTKNEIEEIMIDAQSACDKIGVNIIGGHTEVTDVVNTVVITTTVLAKTKDRILPNRKSAKVGDRILVSKHIALEGTSIIAHDFELESSKYLNEDELNEAKSYSKLLSVKEESLVSRKFRVRALHDITEGGVLGAVWEMATNLGFGAEINFEDIPITNVTKKLTKGFNLNPLRFISSGSMMVIVDREDSEKLIDEAKKVGLLFTDIGSLVETGIVMNKNGEKFDIAEPSPDELYKVV